MSPIHGIDTRAARPLPSLRGDRRSLAADRRRGHIAAYITYVP